jgi:hypothetical protein
MSREWKPGDVAALGELRCFYYLPGREEGRWVSADEGNVLPRGVAELRPLVVIDPEDPEQVERLSEVIRDAEKECGQDFWEYDQTALKLALREFADPKPPKPDEPTGLGAVVEDAEGDLWVRCDAEDHGSWRRANDDALWRDYLSIDAVRVLSEGIDA